MAEFNFSGIKKASDYNMTGVKQVDQYDPNNLASPGDIPGIKAMLGGTPLSGKQITNMRENGDDPWNIGDGLNSIGGFIGGAAKEVGTGLAELGAQGVKGVGNTLGTVADVGTMMFNPSEIWKREAIKKFAQTPEFQQHLASMSPEDQQKALNDVKNLTQSSGEAMNELGNKYVEATGGTALEKTIGETSGVGKAVGGVVGSLAAQIPAMLVGGNVASATSKGTGLSALLKNITKHLAGGAIATEGAAAANEGRLANASELATGAAIDTTTLGLSKFLAGRGNKLFQKVLGFTKDEQGKLAQRGLPVFDIADEVGKKTGVSLSKASLIEKIDKHVSSTAEYLDKIIESTDNMNTPGLVKLGQKFGVNSEDLISNLESRIINPKYGIKFGNIDEAKTTIKKVIDEFRSAVGSNTDLTLPQVQHLKKALGKSNAQFLMKMGNTKGATVDLVNDIIRDNAKTAIEKYVMGAKELNKQMMPLIEAGKKLAKSGEYSGTLTDAIVAGAGGETVAHLTGSAGKGMAAALLLPLVKDAARSTLARTGRATLYKGVSKFLKSPSFLQLLKDTAIQKQTTPVQNVQQ